MSIAFLLFLLFTRATLTLTLPRRTWIPSRKDAPSLPLSSTISTPISRYFPAAMVLVVLLFFLERNSSFVSGLGTELRALS